MQPIKHAVESTFEKVATAIQPGGEVAGQARGCRCLKVFDDVHAGMACAPILCAGARAASRTQPTAIPDHPCHGYHHGRAKDQR